MESTTINTTLEYAVMPIQGYEFECSYCGLICSVRDGHSLCSDTKLCGDCVADWLRTI
jgi:hypothetical protein